MVSPRQAGVAYFVRRVERTLRCQLDGCSRSEVSGEVLPGEPVCSKRNSVIYRLLEPKLASSLVAHRQHFRGEIEDAQRQPSLDLEAFGQFGVEIVASVVGLVLHGYENVLASKK